MTGGRKCWAVINPTVLQVEDLLKLTDWSNSAAHEISSVGSFLSHMATSDCQSLLVLDGINQAPLESYLYPFIQKNFRLNGNALMSAMSLGQNVRLCMIDRTEKVSRLPNWLLKQCCFIPVNDFRLATKSLNHLESKPVDSSCSELSSWDLAVSNEISESVHQQFMEEFSTDFVQRNISRPKLLSTLNFIQSLLFCGLEYEKARNYAAKYCLLPELAALANPKTLQDELGLERESVSSILEHNGSLV